jgi:hypothetical protein
MTRRIISAVAVAFSLLMLFGCGAANLTPSLTAAQQFSITSGNWSFSGSSSTNANSGQFLMGGHLQQNGKTVTGVLHVASSRCFSVDQDIPVSGTLIDESLELKSLPVAHQVFHAALIGHDASMVGSYTIEGGCGNGDAGTLNANVVPSVSGMWNSIDTRADGAVTGVNLALAQSENANGHGVYPLSGTLAFTGSPCQVSGRVTSGYVAGNILVINATTQEPAGGSGSLRMEGDFSAGHVPSIVGAYTYGSGSCKDQAGVLTFTP